LNIKKIEGGERKKEGCIHLAIVVVTIKFDTDTIKLGTLTVCCPSSRPCNMDGARFCSDSPSIMRKCFFIRRRAIRVDVCFGASLFMSRRKNIEKRRRGRWRTRLIQG